MVYIPSRYREGLHGWATTGRIISSFFSLSNSFPFEDFMFFGDPHLEGAAILAFGKKVYCSMASPPIAFVPGPFYSPTRGQFSLTRLFITTEMMLSQKISFPVSQSPALPPLVVHKGFNSQPCYNSAD